MFTLEELAHRENKPFSGDPDLPITGVRPFTMARPGDITLATKKEYLLQLNSTAASAVIVPPGSTSKIRALLFSDNPKATFARVLTLFEIEPFKAAGISPLAYIAPDCTIDPNVSIHPFVSVGAGSVIETEVTLLPGVVIGENCHIGQGSTIHPSVTLYRGVSLGKRVILHSGTVVGADGYGYVYDQGKQLKIPQIGTVEIHDDVEIGANSCVDRATFGSTVIEKNVKLDNHVHIGHNCKIGENTLIVGCVGISGSVVIGKNCILAGQSGVADHIKIGDNVTVMQKTAVTKNIPSNSKVSGPYSRDHGRELRIQAALQRLPEIFADWKKIRLVLEEQDK